MITLQDIVAVDPFNIQASRLADGREATFRLGTLMDRINRKSSNSSLMVTFDATHSGTIVNRRCYPGSHMRKSMVYWTTPYRTPVLASHPSGMPGAPEPDTVGRVREARYIPLIGEDKLPNDWRNPGYRDQGSGFAELKTSITDGKAAEAILGERFLTVSSGMDTNHLFCSCCGSDWAAKKGRCDHSPGQVYKFGDSDDPKLMYFVTGMLYYDHLARVNTPAQPYSTVLHAEFLDSQEMKDLFQSGEVAIGALSGICLIDSRDGVIELLLEPGSHKDPASLWDESMWAEARILTSLADGGRLVDEAPQQALDRIEIFRTSDRETDLHQARFRVGPNGTIPITDALAAEVAMSIAKRGLVRCADQQSLEQRISECASSLQMVDIGGSDMPGTNGPSTKWVGIVKAAAGLDEAKCNDWSDWDGNVYDLVFEDAMGEAQGAIAGLIAEDGKLTTDSRNRLPESAFCGPNRSFPVHDAAHVRNALSRLPQDTNFTDTQKARILANVRRKASVLGVTIGDDELEYSKLISVWDKVTPPDAGSNKDDTILDQEPPKDGKPEQKAKRMEDQLVHAKSRIEDLNRRNSDMVGENKDIRVELHKMFAQKIYDLRTELKKADVLVGVPGQAGSPKHGFPSGFGQGPAGGTVSRHEGSP